MTDRKKNVVIIGAGLVGSLLAIYLVKKGYRVSVYEKRADIRKTTGVAGRSINLALSDRGIKALEEVGVMDDIRGIAVPMHGRQIHHVDESQVYQPYGQEGQFINSVSRSELNSRLISFAENSGAEFFFGHSCEKIQWNTNSIEFKTGDKSIQVATDLIFGSDGAFSSARLNYMLQHDRFQYQQSYIDYGYKELHIAAGDEGTFLFLKNALHIWPRGNYMLIALPNTDGSFTCTLFFPFKGEPSFESLDTGKKVKDFFEATFPDATRFFPDIEESFFKNPASSLVTIHCFPWIHEDSFSLIGDAAHAIVPFFGQGMNCGFEDCRVLNSLIDEYNHEWSSILPAFQSLRKPDADAIAEMALLNFIEMRDKVADPKFLLQKKIEAGFSKKYPDKWIPSYAQVTFSPEIRYSEALENSRVQQEIMNQVMDLTDLEEKLETGEIETIMLQKLSRS